MSVLIDLRYVLILAINMLKSPDHLNEDTFTVFRNPTWFKLCFLFILSIFISFISIGISRSSPADLGASRETILSSIDLFPGPLNPPKPPILLHLPQHLSILDALWLRRCCDFCAIIASISFEERPMFHHRYYCSFKF